MSFSCKTCRERFIVGKLLAGSQSEVRDYSVVSTFCGHLFHRKCLESVLTNQKLLHMRHGTGPLRRFCPVYGCNADIQSEDHLIKISLSEEDSESYNESSADTIQDTSGKLAKRIQSLTSEKAKLSENLERAVKESEMLRSALDEIKFDLSDIRSFLHDDNLMRKGDLIFWMTKDGTYAPGKIIEIRKKPGESDHYAIVKLDNKTKVSGIGPHAVERDTMILPLSELTTFKSFFGDFFDQFGVKFDSLIVDLNAEIQELSLPLGAQPSDRSAAYYRSTRKLSRSVSRTYINSMTSLNELGSVVVESVTVPSAKKISHPFPDTQRSRTITRSKTIHCGVCSEQKPRRMEKARSMSWATTPTNLLASPPASESSRSSRSFQDLLYSPTTEESEEAVLEEGGGPNEFIREGERIIWYDSHSNYKQVGIVAAVCEYSPCAIVKFDEHPLVKYKFQYRTVPLDELFPYDLASREDKLRIAEAYGKAVEFIESRECIFTISPTDEFTSEFEESQEFEDIHMGLTHEEQI